MPGTQELGARLGSLFRRWEPLKETSSRVNAPPPLPPPPQDFNSRHEDDEFPLILPTHSSQLYRFNYSCSNEAATPISSPINVAACLHFFRNFFAMFL